MTRPARRCWDNYLVVLLEGAPMFDRHRIIHETHIPLLEFGLPPLLVASPIRHFSSAVKERVILL